MSKFKIKMKLQGLELEVEGSREDMSLISQNLGQQMAGLLQPAGAIIEGEVLGQPQYATAGAGTIAPFLPDTSTKKPTKRRKSTAPSNANGSEKAKTEAIDWTHEPAKFGMPKQAWSTSKKAMWLLYVVREAAGVGELSANQIAATFSKHFKQSGMIRSFTVTRDLGNLKAKSVPTPISEDTTKSPSLWFLTDEGNKQVQQLIATSNQAS